MKKVNPEDIGINSFDDYIIIVDPQSKKKELMKIGHTKIS